MLVRLKPCRAAMRRIRPAEMYVGPGRSRTSWTGRSWPRGADPDGPVGLVRPSIGACVPCGPALPLIGLTEAGAPSEKLAAPRALPRTLEELIQPQTKELLST